MTTAPVEIPSPEGNAYALEMTIHGDPTFRHIATGEVLHGQVGPWKEALQLYVGPAGLAERTEPAVVFDVGMGCGAQLLAAYEAFEANPRFPALSVVSFDLEKAGLVALREHSAAFPHAARNASLIDAMIASDEVERALPDGRTFRWRFLRGDFKEVIARAARGDLAASVPKADFVFYDFFSPASHPSLWSVAVFRDLRSLCGPRARLATYAGATCVRAALSAAGFYVGLGIPSGRKKNSTEAAVDPRDLGSPLPRAWRVTFLTSHKPFVEGASEEEQKAVREGVLANPQFLEG